MLPLTMASTGEEVMVVKTGGNDEMKRHLEDLGFVPGASVSVVSNAGDGNVIVIVKESHLAITNQMAGKVMVEPGKMPERSKRSA